MNKHYNFGTSQISKEVKHYFENELINQQENSRKEIDLFEINRGLKNNSKNRYISTVSRDIAELQKLGARREKVPGFFLYSFNFFYRQRIRSS
jgi:hypothetical protein